MPSPSTLEQIIERQVHVWESRQRSGAESGRERAGAVAEGPWISVSKQWGTGGQAIARHVAERLGWQVFDREILRAIAERTKTREVVLSRLDQRATGTLNDYLAQLVVPGDPGQMTFLSHMVRVIWTLGRQGQAVIVGRGANWILDPRFGLRVRLVAPPDVRARAVATELGIPEDEARRRVAEDDHAQESFIRQVFGRRIDDPLGYDLTLNVAALGAAAVERTLRDALENKLGATTA